MSLEATAKRLVALDDDTLTAAFRHAADTSGTENTIIHHLAALEMRKRALPLGRRTSHHRRPIVVDAREVDGRTVRAPRAVAKQLAANVMLTTVLNYNGFDVRVTPVAKAKDVKVGEFVTWNASGGAARGKVEQVVRTGKASIPDSSFSVTAEPDDPALLIRIWSSTSEGNESTDRIVGHKMSTVRKIPALTETVNKTVKEEDGRWCVYSADGSRSFGCYDTPAEAKSRLRQIEAFKSVTHPIPDSVRKAAVGVEDARSLVRLSRLPETMVPAMKRATVVAAPEAFTWLESLDTVEKAAGVKPSARVRETARRAVKWIDEGKAGKGFTSVGRRRAQQLAAGETVSQDTVRRMRSFFSRHEGDKSATGFKQGQAGYPSPGRVAWDAWGGDAGRAWANQQFRRAEANKARPENPWKRGYNTEYFAARDEMLAKSPKCVVCKTAKATEVDHIKSLKDGGSNAKSNLRPVCASCNRKDGGGERADAKKGFVSKAIAEKRYTLGPMYIPDSIDAQGEWTDAEELQKAVWKYVQSGDRRIRLQHNRDVVAGEWVECMAWPYPVEVPMMHPDGTADVTEFPANTVFLGVIWDDWAWDMVKSGSLKGYSIGGAAARVLADLPEA